MHDIYPKRYFDESKTWFAWNKLTIADIYTLRQEPGFEGQNVFFYLNHPIRLVRIVGLVVQINAVASTKFVLLTIDDSSGANIEVKVERQLAEHGEFVSSTTVSNVEATIELGEPKMRLDEQPLLIGSVVRAQGELESYRNQRQVVLNRLFRVKDTNEEAIHWSKAADWKRTVLNAPWILSREQQEAVDERLRKEERERNDKAKKKRRLQIEHDEKQTQRDARREARRLAEQEKMDSGALEGSEVLPKPWD